MLARIFKEKKDITDSIDGTSWTPVNQINGVFSVSDINISTKDNYDTENKKADFEKFAKGVEKSIKDDNLGEVLMQLFSQFIPPKKVALIINAIDYIIEPLVFGQLDTQLVEFRKNLSDYQVLIKKYNCNLVVKKEEEINGIALGSVPYFAMVSHSLSHTRFWGEAEAALRSVFSSGENPGYKK